MFTISKQFAFSASHQLTHLPAEHPCARLHGHNYRVEVVLKAERTDGRGFIFDYKDLDGFKKWIDDRLDHQHLNEVLGDSLSTTAEHLAKFIFGAVEQLTVHKLPDGVRITAVRVSETDKTWAEYAP